MSERETIYRCSVCGVKKTFKNWRKPEILPYKCNSCTRTFFWTLQRYPGTIEILNEITNILDNLYHTKERYEFKGKLESLRARVASLNEEEMLAMLQAKYGVEIQGESERAAFGT